MEIDKENVVQAVIVMDTFNNNFVPIVNNKPMVRITQFANIPRNHRKFLNKIVIF